MIARARIARRPSRGRAARAACLSLVALATLTACDAEAPPRNTGGTDVPAGPCGRGVVALSSDYQSTNVSFVGLDGEVLSSSVISSATVATGLSAPLSGDVVVPTEPSFGPEVVLVDRYPTSTVTWIDVATGGVRAQLSVATGFASNPQDYLPLSDARAYVSRFEHNHAPGDEPFDEGDDFLVVDPRVPAVVGRVDLSSTMSDAPGFFPRPSRMVRAGGLVYVLLSAYSADFVETAPSRVATVDPETDTVRDVTLLDGLHGCSGLAVSPEGDELAIACSGKFAGTSQPELDRAGVVRLARGERLAERARYTAAELGGGPLAFTAAYASARTLLVVTFGRSAEGSSPALDDLLLEIDLDTGAPRPVLRSAGSPFTLGEVQCASACGACFVADARPGGGLLHRFDVDAEGHLGDPRAIVVAPEIGLPPRYLGRF